MEFNWSLTYSQPNFDPTLETITGPFVNSRRISGPSFRLGQSVVGETGFTGPMPLSIQTVCWLTKLLFDKLLIDQTT